MHLSLSTSILLAIVTLTKCISDEYVEDRHGVILPTKCEVCKYLAMEVMDRVRETGKSKEKIRLGHGLSENPSQKTVNYATSELRLNEILHEPSVCDRLKTYNLHKERKGSLRFAKGRSQTFETLHGLVNKGVKVDLGIPYELWDETSAEVSALHRECSVMLNEQEETLEDWYFTQQSKSLLDFLCRDHVLRTRDGRLSPQATCLDEVWTGVETVDEASANAKGDTGQSTSAKAPPAADFRRKNEL